MRWLVLLLAGGCRIGFDPIGAAGSDAAGGDDDATLAPDAFVDPTLLMHFTFDGDVRTDSSIGAHHATCTSCPATVPSPLGRAAVFTARISECMSIAAPALRPSRFTIAAWVNADVATNMTVFSRPLNGTAGTENTFELAVRPSNMWDFVFNSGSHFVAAGPGVWHHAAGVFDGGNWRLYVDGVSAGANATGAPVYASDDFQLGCDRNVAAYVNEFDGMIDDVRLYDRILTSTEVAALATR